MLSVIILTNNDEAILESCIKSVVGLMDELVIVDEGSTDRTLEIAKKYTDKIVVNETKTGELDFAKKRNDGLKLAKGDWIFYLDSDERVLKDLGEQLIGLMQAGKAGAWAIPRRNVILGTEVRYKAFWPDYVVRFFKRDSLIEWEGKVHEQPKFRGDLAHLSTPLLHLTHRDIDSMVLKSLRWSNIDANLRLEAKHPMMSGLRFIRIVLTEMWYQGVIRRGFFNGSVGTIDALVQTFSLFISYARLWQLQQDTTLAKKYQQLDDKLIEKDFQW